MLGLTWVPRARLGEGRIVSLKETLLITGKTSDTYSTGDDEAGGKFVQTWQERAGELGIPRYYAKRLFGIDYEDGVRPPAVIPWGPHDLAPDQSRAVAGALDTIKQWGGVIFQAGCGTGKTPMSLALACALQTRTLITVHKEYLMGQWLEEIEKFTGVPRSRVGIIQGSKITLGDEFTIGIVNSLADKEYPDEVYRHFGCVLSDEVHRMGAPVWSKAMPRFAAAALVGLSATPDRPDGLAMVFELQIGPVYQARVVSKSLPAKIYPCKTDIVLSAEQHMRDKKGRIILGKVQTKLAKMADRNRLLANIAVQAVKAGRKVIMFSHRTDQLDALEELIPAGMAAQFVGGMDKADLDEASQKPILLSTVQMAQDAMNVKPLDTLIMCTPWVGVEQAIGRICRPHPDKKEPLVIDPIDIGEIPAEMYLARARHYSRLDYKVLTD